MLKGRIVNLKQMLIEDIPILQKWFLENTLAVKYLGSRLASIEAVKQYFEKALNEPFERRDFMIESIKEQKPIGAMSLEKINWIDRRTEAVIFLGEKGLRKREYIYDAYMLLFEYAFNELNLNKIYWYMLEFNSGIFETLNQVIREATDETYPSPFKKEGYLQDAAFYRGKYYGIYIYGISASDYNMIKEKFLKYLKEKYLCKGTA